jgi:hypothetical protein
MKAVLLGLSLMLVAPGARGEERQSPMAEPALSELAGTWEPDKAALERLPGKAATSRLRELVLRQNGTFLLQGIPVEWTATAPGKMPAGRYEGQGKWQWRRNGEKWELLLQIGNVSLVVGLHGEPSAYELVVPSRDAQGGFETVVHRVSLNE